MLFQLEVSHYGDKKVKETWVVESPEIKAAITKAEQHGAAETMDYFTVHSARMAPFAEIVGPVEENRYIVAINFIYGSIEAKNLKKVKRQMLVNAPDDDRAKDAIKQLYANSTDEWEFQKVEKSGIGTILL